jgi:soluble lytic murein transglycosylase
MFHSRHFRCVTILVCICLLPELAGSASGGSRAAAHIRQTSGAAPNSPAARELESLARELRDGHGNRGESAASVRLAAFAHTHARDALGARAALALGYDAYRGGHYAVARDWLRRASGEPLLGEYVLYWSAVCEQNLAQNSEAFADWEQFVKRYPHSVLANSALESFAALAIQQNRAPAALAVLEFAPAVNGNPELLFLRGRARAASGQLAAAAGDFVAVYYGFPLSSSSQGAGQQLALLRAPLGEQFPKVSAEQQLARADVLIDAHHWHDALDAYLGVMPLLGGVQSQLAKLGEARCRAKLGGGPAALADLHFTDADVDAQRLAALTDFYRDRNDEANMIAAANAAATRAPDSAGAAEALFNVGNFYWVRLDRASAAGFYDRAAKASPGIPNAAAAAWRAAWFSFLTSSPETGTGFDDFLRQFPDSGFMPDMLYWAGRWAELHGQPQRARAYYIKLQARFTQAYFGILGAQRLRALGAGPVDSIPLLEGIPPVPPAPMLDSPVPPEAADRVARAQALGTIALDSFAEKEYRQAWKDTGNARLLLDAARAADSGERYPSAIVIVRQLYPQTEDRRFDDVPLDVWLAGYALPYSAEVRRAGAAMGVDPMIIAGLIRQESAFDAQARSGAGAVGLMQLLPKTARLLARKLRMPYSAALLTNPQYNLRLGSAYFAQLTVQFGSPEAALAAYNAGEDRVIAWRAGLNNADTAEFVESIPFSETRDYVQIVIRNAAIFRRLYGDHQ